MVAGTLCKQRKHGQYNEAITMTSKERKELLKELKIESDNDIDPVFKTILDDQEDALNQSTSKVLHHNKDNPGSEMSFPPGRTLGVNEQTNRQESVSGVLSNPKLEDDDNLSVNMKSLSGDPRRKRIVTETLQRYRKPVPAYKETKSCIEVLETMQKPDVDSQVVHIYGFPGNGKSQIVCAVCRKMDEVNSEVIIWHIKCTNGSRTVRSECLKLADKLTKARLVDKKVSARVKEDMEDGDSQPFVQMLLELNILVLIAVEDVAIEEQDLFAKFIQDVHDAKRHKTSIPNTGLKVLISTQKRHAFYPEDQLKAMHRYCLVEIEGFDQSEAEEFLASGLQAAFPAQSELNAVAKLASDLAYSPLRLTFCKSYCQKYEVSYKCYLEQLGNSETVIKREKELVKDHPSLANFHGYEVIMKLLKPDVTEPEKSYFPVMEMLSFMANKYIPKPLLRKLYHQCHKTMSWQKTEERMETMIVALKDKHVFQEHNNLLSTHADILYAVNLSIPKGEKGRKLYEILQALIEIISKDNRASTDNNLLYNLHKHIEIAIEHACKHLDATFNLKSPRKIDFFIQMNLCGIYDVLGFVRSHNHTKESPDECFGKALDIMIAVISSYDGKSLCCGLTKKPMQSGMLKYSPDKEPEVVVKELYKQIEKASKRIPVEFVSEYFKPCFPKRYLEDMKSYLKGKKAEVEWKLMDEELDENGQLSSKSVEILRGVQMVLTPEQLGKCFLLEIIVSVLHSRGRQLLYMQGSIDVSEQKRYEWYSKVGYLLAQKFSQKNDIKIINEYITVANCILPRKLQNRNGELDEAFLERLTSARNTAKKILQPEGLFYERGVFRLIAGTAYTKMNALKYVVKANTKLRKRPGVYRPTKEAEMEEDDDCEKLFTLAKENANLTMSGNCRVQVGKYYAATKKFDKAIWAFDSAFSYENEGINKDFEAKPNTFAWALYNYGRAICVASPDMESLNTHRKRFVSRYDIVIDKDVNNVWEGRLRDLNEELQHLAQR